METLTYRQTERLKRLWFIIIYFGLLIAFMVYASTNYDVLNFINSFKSSTLLGLMGGIVFLSPVLLVVKLTTYKVTLKFDDEYFRIQERSREIPVHYSDIETMYLNRRRPSELEVRDRNNTLIYNFWALHHGDILDTVVHILEQKIPFQKTKKKVTTRGAHYYAITFTKMKNEN